MLKFTIPSWLLWFVLIFITYGLVEIIVQNFLISLAIVGGVYLITATITYCVRRY